MGGPRQPEAGPEGPWKKEKLTVPWGAMAKQGKPGAGHHRGGMC